MPEFTVRKPCRPDGRTYMDKGDVTLTDGQAKYLVLSGHLTPKVREDKTQESTAPEAKKPAARKKAAQ